MQETKRLRTIFFPGKDQQPEAPVFTGVQINVTQRDILLLQLIHVIVSFCFQSLGYIIWPLNLRMVERQTATTATVRR